MEMVIFHDFPHIKDVSSGCSNGRWGNGAGIQSGHGNTITVIEKPGPWHPAPSSTFLGRSLHVFTLAEKALDRSTSLIF